MAGGLKFIPKACLLALGLAPLAGCNTVHAGGGADVVRFAIPPSRPPLQVSGDVMPYPDPGALPRDAFLTLDEERELLGLKPIEVVEEKKEEALPPVDPGEKKHHRGGSLGPAGPRLEDPVETRLRKEVRGAIGGSGGRRMFEFDGRWYYEGDTIANSHWRVVGISDETFTIATLNGKQTDTLRFATQATDDGCILWQPQLE